MQRLVFPGANLYEMAWLDAPHLSSLSILIFSFDIHLHVEISWMPRVTPHPVMPLLVPMQWSATHHPAGAGLFCPGSTHWPPASLIHLGTSYMNLSGRKVVKNGTDHLRSYCGLDCVKSWKSHPHGSTCYWTTFIFYTNLLLHLSNYVYIVLSNMYALNALTLV